jgi:uncharacterized membrane protein YkoI
MCFLRKSIGLLAMGLVMTCVSWAMADAAADLAKTPKAVQDTVKKVLGSHELEGIGKEIEEGKPIYEAEYVLKGVSYVFVVAEDGKLLEHGVEVDQSFVPEAVMATVKKTQPNAKIAEVAIMVGNGRLYFTVEVKVGQDLHILRISAGGRLNSDTNVKSEEESAEPAKTEKKG